MNQDLGSIVSRSMAISEKNEATPLHNSQASHRAPPQRQSQVNEEIKEEHQSE